MGDHPTSAELSKRRESGVPAVRQDLTDLAPEFFEPGEFDSLLWLSNIRTEQVFSLSGTGADLWRWLACWGSIETAARRLAEMYGIDADSAHQDTLAFAAELGGAGLLEQVA